MIEKVNLGMVNAYLLINNENVILVDTGMKDPTIKISEVLATYNLTIDSINLILLTHGHLDHIGGLAPLKAVIDAPVMMSRIEYEMSLDHSDDSLPTGRIGRLIRKLGANAQRKAPKVYLEMPDILLEDGYDLSEFGYMAEAVLTPGHTRGSLSILTSKGEAIIGDTLMAMMPWNGPGKPLLAYDMNQVKASIEMLIQAGAKIFYVAHGDNYPLARIKGAIEYFNFSN